MYIVHRTAHTQFYNAGKENKINNESGVSIDRHTCRYEHLSFLFTSVFLEKLAHTVSVFFFASLLLDLSRPFSLNSRVVQPIRLLYSLSMLTSSKKTPINLLGWVKNHETSIVARYRIL